MQTEAYRLFGYSPQQTLNIAQSLYTKAYISYPRTSSEKLPKQIKYKNILSAISKFKSYSPLVKKLLSGDLIPNEGKRRDPAHEAIHPTTEPPKDLGKLTRQEKNIYDLVCRRFMAVFGEPAKRERVSILLRIGKERYKLTGRRTVEKGWIEYYGRLAKFNEVILPDIEEGDKIKVVKIELLSKETSPPPRYSQASLIKEMEKRGLGTRATRAAILQTLYDRNYVVDKSIKVTELGMKVANVLARYVPDFVDEKLTRKFEKELERIFQRKVKKESVIRKAKKAVEKISKEFKENDMKIGKELGKGVINTQNNQSILGKCPNCKTGDLKIMFSRRTRKYFVGCSNYPKCKTGYPLPHNATIRPTGKVCDKCGTPIVQVWRKGKRPFRMCLDPNCPTKKDWNKQGKPKKS